jgi:triacylglycerol esterase/lipase EstA (alpha/beta hydrolase family)
VQNTRETFPSINFKSDDNKNQHNAVRALRSNFQSFSLGYPSRDHKVQELAAIVRHKVEQASTDATIVHFVTHSMGGILVRQMHKTKPIEKLGRVVMLSPLNQGSWST